MEQYAIWGGNPLVGEVEIGGAKNAALPILAASLLTDDTVLIDNMPDIRDINVLLDAMKGIGVVVERLGRHQVKINAAHIHTTVIEGEGIRKMRASYYFLARCLESINQPASDCPAAARSAHARLTSTLKGLRRSGRRSEWNTG